MKKYLSVLLIVLLSVFSFNMEVDAAQEMTCLYKGFPREKYMFVMDNNGVVHLYINKESSELVNGGIVGNWNSYEYKSLDYEGNSIYNVNIKYVLTSCPEYIYVMDGKINLFNRLDYWGKKYNSGSYRSLDKEKSTEKKAIIPYKYEFKVNKSTAEDVLFNHICADETVYSANKYICMTNDIDGNPREISVNNQYNYNNSIKKFYIKTWYNSFDSLKSGLEDVMCYDNGHNCLEYVKNEYCNNNVNEGVCLDIKNDGVTEFEPIISTNDDTTTNNNEFSYPIIFYGNFFNSNEVTKTIYFAYNLDNNVLDVYVKDNDISLNNYDHSLSYLGNTLYLYGYGSDFETFQSRYIEQVKQSSERPQLSFCLRSRKGNKFAWYTELGTCDSNIYDDFYSQTINPNGSVDDGRDEALEGDSNEIAGFEIYETCTEFLSNNDAIKLRDTLKFIVQLSRVLIPIIVFVFSTLDFAKAVFSGEEQTKKVKTNFFMRIAIAVVIFLLPTLLHFLLTIANQIWPNISTDLCGIL